MTKYITSGFIAAFLLAIVFCSCTSQQKIISTKKEIETKDNELQKHNKALREIEAQLRKKQERNEIDDSSIQRIRKFIGISQSELEKLEAQNAILTGKKTVDRSDWPNLKKNLQLTERLSKIMADKVEMISDLIHRNLVVKIDQDVIFEPGQFHVTPALASALTKVFEPAATEIDRFIKKYPDFPITVIVNANGYADATSIAEGTTLYKDLKSRLKTDASGNKELNKELSRLRAEEVMALFKKFFDSRFPPEKNITTILYTYEGKGEALPNPKISDYKTDDPRRRVVLLYWSVFPE